MRTENEEIIKRITDKNDEAAYSFFVQMVAESAESDKYSSMIDDFASLLEAKSSYIKIRAFGLICSQARWDKTGKIKAVFDRMIPVLNSEKPIVVRQCLTFLRELIQFSPEMRDEISKAVKAIDLSRYKDSMRPLIQKDAAALINQ